MIALLDSIEAKEKDLTMKQFVDFSRIYALFKVAFKSISESLANRKELQEYEAAEKDAKEKLITTRTNLEKYATTVSNGKQRIEEVNSTISTLEVEILQLQNNLAKAKQEKTMLAQLQPNLDKKHNEVASDAKQLSQTIYSLQQKVAICKQKESNFNANYATFEADFKGINAAFPF